MTRLLRIVFSSICCRLLCCMCFAIFFGNWMLHKSWNCDCLQTKCLIVSHRKRNTMSHLYMCESWFYFCISSYAVRSRSLLSVENPQNFQQAACDWFRHIFFRDEGEIRQQSDNKETHLNSNYRSYRTDIYTALTPFNALQMDNGTQHNNYVSVKAWNFYFYYLHEF